MVLNAIAFGYYGYQCLQAEVMRLEFERFQLAAQRKMVGYLQIIGSLGLLVGIFIPFIGFFAAAGLSILMAFGVAVRIKIGDKIIAILPAFILSLINGFISFTLYHLVFQ